MVLRRFACVWLVLFGIGGSSLHAADSLNIDAKIILGEAGDVKGSTVATFVHALKYKKLDGTEGEAVIPGGNITSTDDAVSFWAYVPRSVDLAAPITLVERGTRFLFYPAGKAQIAGDTITVVFSAFKASVLQFEPKPTDSVLKVRFCATLAEATSPESSGSSESLLNYYVSKPVALRHARLLFDLETEDSITFSIMPPLQQNVLVAGNAQIVKFEDIVSYVFIPGQGMANSKWKAAKKSAEAQLRGSAIANQFSATLRLVADPR